MKKFMKKLKLSKKMIMIIIGIVVIIFVVLIITLPKKNGNGEIILNKKLTYDVNSEVNLLSLISKDNKYEILSKDEKIDTTIIGEKPILIKYKKDGKEKNYTFVITIVDTTAPSIDCANELVVAEGSTSSLLENVTVNDNSGEDIKATVVGKYDLNKIGTYELSYSAVDSSGNKTLKGFTLKVEKKSNTSNNNTSNNNTSNNQSSTKPSGGNQTSTNTSGGSSTPAGGSTQTPVEKPITNADKTYEYLGTYGLAKIIPSFTDISVIPLEVNNVYIKGNLNNSIEFDCDITFVVHKFDEKLTEPTKFFFYISMFNDKNEEVGHGSPYYSYASRVGESITVHIDGWIANYEKGHDDTKFAFKIGPA